MEETRTDGGSASGGRPQKQYPERLGKGLHADSVGWTHSEDTDSSPSGATLKRLKLKVGGLATNTLHLTPGHRPSPEVTPQSLPAGRLKPFQPNPPLEGHRRTVPPNLDLPASEEKSAKRKRRAIVENSDEEESLESDDTDYSDSDSPPPVRKRAPLQRPEEPPAGTEHAFREKRSPKPKVIWDPNDGGGRDMRGEKSKKAAKSKGTPNSARKGKRPAEDPGEEGFSKRAEREVLDVPVEGFGVSPPRERRLSKPRVIWDPDDDDDRELLRVVSKNAEPRGPVSPKVHASPRQYVSPKQASKKANKASAVSMYDREGFREPASEIPNPETLGQKASPLATPMSPGKPRQALPSVQIDSLRLPTTLHSPHMGAYSPHPGSATRGAENIDRSKLGSPNLAPAMSPGKQKEALGGGLGSPQALGVLPESRSPSGFKVPSGKSRLHNTEQLHVRGDWKGDGTVDGGREFQPMEAQHELASPGKRLSDKKRLREDTEAERQLKKEERARKRKAETEKAAREVQASAIQKILGQESTRKKREEAVQKRRDAKEEERLASGNEAPSDMVRVTDNASGVTLVWPATVPFPAELEQAPREFDIVNAE